MLKEQSIIYMKKRNGENGEEEEGRGQLILSILT